MSDPVITARNMRANELTPEKTFLHFQQLVEDLAWLSTAGKRLLEKNNPLSFKQWLEFFNRADRVYIDGSHGFSFRFYYYMVLERGFKDLLLFIQSLSSEQRDKPSEQWGDIYRWEAMLTQIIAAERILHLDPRTTGGRETLIKLTNWMLPIVQELKSEASLTHLARERFPDDAEAVELYVKAHKNW